MRDLSKVKKNEKGYYIERIHKNGYLAKDYGQIQKCLFCKKVFFAKNFEIRKNRGKFCSYKCRWKGGVPWNKNKKTGIIPSNIFKKGHIPWNTRKHLSSKIRKKMSMNKKKYYESSLGKEYKEKISRTSKGRIPWNKGKINIYSEKTLQNISKKQKGKHHSPKTEFKKGQFSGEKSPHWQGGISRLPYPFRFNNELKEQIRKRDNYVCQFPKCDQKQNGKAFPIHHIDYDKNNLNFINLITLCNNHNVKVNFNRSRWQKYFQKLMENRRYERNRHNNY